MTRPTANATAIIPARIGSARFPEKVLASDTGRPLIRHVCEATTQAASIQRVIVATDDDRVRQAVTAFGGEVVMTRSDHPNGTSRLAEAAATIDLPHDAIVVNVQGDEPEMRPEVIDACVSALLESGMPMATCATAASAQDTANPNVVKVVVAQDGRALYFSRASIPHPGKASAHALRHIGIYAYRRSFLDEYVALPATPLEQAERLEQLRVLEHGRGIAVAVCNSDQIRPGIDTPEQYREFVARWRRDHPA